MASKTKHTTDPSDPSALKRRVWVIESRHKGLADGTHPFDWWVNEILTDATEADAVFRCNYLSEERVTCNYRYRHATLTFDDDGGRCVIY